MEVVDIVRTRFEGLTLAIATDPASPQYWTAERVAAVQQSVAALGFNTVLLRADAQC